MKRDLLTRWTMLLAIILMVSGCSRSNDNGADDEDFRPPTYTVGEPIDDPQIAAVVESEYGSDTLTTDFFRMQYDLITERIPQLAGDPAQLQELRRNIVEEFVRRHVVFGEADRQQIVIDSADVAEQIQQIQNQFAGEEQFEEALAANNLTIDSLRMSIQDDRGQQRVLEQIAESAVLPDDGEVDRYRNEQAEEVRAQHILFLTNPGMAADERDSLRQRATAVLDSARSGTDFAELARRHSDDGSSVQGGDLGYFRRGQMVPEFERAAFALSDSGDVTRDLVETQYGYHIIRLTDKRTGDVMDAEMARQRLEQQRKQRIVQERMRDMVEAVTIHVNEDVVQADLNQPLNR